MRIAYAIRYVFFGMAVAGGFISTSFPNMAPFAITAAVLFLAATLERKP